MEYQATASAWEAELAEPDWRAGRIILYQSISAKGGVDEGWKDLN